MYARACHALFVEVALAAVNLHVAMHCLLLLPCHVYTPLAPHPFPHDYLPESMIRAYRHVFSTNSGRELRHILISMRHMCTLQVQS